jgi:hypothetical protein
MSLSQSTELHSEFAFPEDGTYINEVYNGQPTLLLNEDEITDFSNDRYLRNLDNFFIFKPSTKKCCPTSFLWESDGPYEACGWVVPQYDGYEQDGNGPYFKDLEGINIRTSTIWRYSLEIDHEYVVHYFSITTHWHTCILVTYS